MRRGIFGGLGAIYLLLLIVEVSHTARVMPGFAFYFLGVMALIGLTVILLLAGGIGYLMQKGWGRACGNVYSVTSLLSTLVWVLILPIPIGWTTILGTVYPVTTLVLINTRFKDAFVD